MAKKVQYESLIEQLTKEYGESYKTTFRADRAEFNLPPALRPMTKQEQSTFSNPVGGGVWKHSKPGSEEKFSDENSQLSIKGSSTIQAAAYWPSKEYLVVSFKSGGSYSYNGVPLSVVLQWEQASSAGSFFYYNIRTSFQYAKV